jgi:hypothetical protein
VAADLAEGGKRRCGREAGRGTADGFEAERERARALWNALQPHHQNVYVNFLMEEGEDRIRECPGGLPSEHV